MRPVSHGRGIGGARGEGRQQATYAGGFHLRVKGDRGVHLVDARRGWGRGGL
jgi:hypothetical protein